MPFKNRSDAGKQLAEKLYIYKGDQSGVVIGLPRGGVPVAFEIAQKLQLPLDIIVPRKIGAPDNEELAIGAVTEMGEPLLDERLVGQLGVDQAHINKLVSLERQEAKRRLETYRHDRGTLELKHKTAILVDDGAATGATMRAAIHTAKEKGADKIVLALPAAAPDTARELKRHVDEAFILETPALFSAIGQLYDEFEPTSDAEVRACLKEAKKP